MLKHLSKRTKVLLSVILGMVILATGVYLWAYLSGSFSSSASTLPTGTAIADVKDASSNAQLDGVTFAIDGSTCTTGATGPGRCSVPGVVAGQKTGTFTKTGYTKTTVSRTCSFIKPPWGRGTPSCTFETRMKKIGATSPTPVQSPTSKIFIGSIYKVVNGVTSTACMDIVGPAPTSGGCTVNLTITPTGSKQWLHVGRKFSAETVVSVSESLAPGSYQITGGNFTSPVGASFDLIKVNGTALPYSFTMPSTQNFSATLKFAP